MNPTAPSTSGLDGPASELLPGVLPTGYDDPTQPCTPAWQEQFTSVPAAKAERIGREFAKNAEESRGRSMILMGAGTNHWFHSDTIYRAFLVLTTLTGCQGVNGGGWAHYVGRDRGVRPVRVVALHAAGPRLQRAGLVPHPAVCRLPVAVGPTRVPALPRRLGAGRFSTSVGATALKVGRLAAPAPSESCGAARDHAGGQERHV